MADPVGAATLAQMFSPTKSPFHALNLISITCLYLTLREPLADYGAGFAMSVLIGATILAPFFRPNYDDKVYGLSVMFGRSAGLIGSLIAMVLLIKGSAYLTDTSMQKLNVKSDLFKILWFCIMLHAAYMALLFLTKARLREDTVPRFNVIQFCLMESTLLIFIVLIATGDQAIQHIDLRQAFIMGCNTILKAPQQIFFGAHHIEPLGATFGLLIVWCLSGLVNIFLACWELVPGWITDHGAGEHN